VGGGKKKEETCKTQERKKSLLKGAPWRRVYAINLRRRFFLKSIAIQDEGISCDQNSRGSRGSTTWYTYRKRKRKEEEVERRKNHDKPFLSASKSK